MVNWIVDEYILETRSLIGDLLGSIEKSGANLHATKYIPFAPTQDYGPAEWAKQPTVLYGTHGYIKRCSIPFIPGAYGVSEMMHCNQYYSHIPPEWMLNEQFVMTTFADLQRRPEKYFLLFNAKKLFIRPNNGFKTFAGTVITKDNANFELSSSMQLTSVMPETIILIAPCRTLEGEFRFVIGDKEVIDGSEYRWESILDIRHDWPQECWDVADKMAKHPWQPDVVYTCDVALTKFGPKIIEINGFACAGLYACDKDIVVNRINEIAQKDFEGKI